MTVNCCLAQLLTCLQPKEAFKLAYKKTPDEIERLKLEEEHLSGANCMLHFAQDPLSHCTQGQTLIIVFGKCLGHPVNPLASLLPEISAQPQSAVHTETSLVRKFKDMKLTNTAPSATGQFEAYKKMQENTGERIWDDRPKKDKHIAPIVLIYPPFGYFHDIRCGTKVPGEQPSDEGVIREQVDLLAVEMAKFHDDEKARSSKFIQCLEKILFIQGESVKSSKVLNTKYITDASYDGAHGAMIFCMECKKELSLASCEPVPQLVAYIAASIKSQMASGGRTADLFEKWRAPALGVMLVGEFALDPLPTLLDRDVQDPSSNFLELSGWDTCASSP